MFNNQVWLALALIGTFSTILVLGVVVDAMLNSRRRYATVLQTQVGGTADSVANLRNEQLKSSALERLIFPFTGKVISSITRHTPLDLYRRVNRLIELAGNPPSLTAERIVAFKIVFGIVGVTQQQISQPEDRLLVNLHQLLPCLRISLAGGADPIALLCQKRTCLFICNTYTPQPLQVPSRRRFRRVTGEPRLDESPTTLKRIYIVSNSLIRRWSSPSCRKALTLT